jgi:hypothetical protein
MIHSHLVAVVARMLTWAFYRDALLCFGYSRPDSGCGTVTILYRRTNYYSNNLFLLWVQDRLFRMQMLVPFARDLPS